MHKLLKQIRTIVLLFTLTLSVLLGQAGPASAVPSPIPVLAQATAVEAPPAVDEAAEAKAAKAAAKAEAKAAKAAAKAEAKKLKQEKEAAEDAAKAEAKAAKKAAKAEAKKAKEAAKAEAKAAKEAAKAEAEKGEEVEAPAPVETPAS